jgi:hypothetical protein
VADERALEARWYPVADDTIGGWAIANIDLPVSQLDTRGGKHFTVGDFLSEDIARHICELHNVRLESPLPDSETEPDNWEAGAYIEPGIGGVANVSTSGWPGGVERVWLRVDAYFDKNRGADIVLEPDEADEIAGVLRGAARSVRRDRGEVTS